MLKIRAARLWTSLLLTRLFADESSGLRRSGGAPFKARAPSRLPAITSGNRFTSDGLLLPVQDGDQRGLRLEIGLDDQLEDGNRLVKMIVAIVQNS